jgi:hypothetical protein
LFLLLIGTGTPNRQSPHPSYVVEAYVILWETLLRKKGGVAT